MRIIRSLNRGNLGGVQGQYLSGESESQGHWGAMPLRSWRIFVISIPKNSLSFIYFFKWKDFRLMYIKVYKIEKDRKSHKNCILTHFQSLFNLWIILIFSIKYKSWQATQLCYQIEDQVNIETILQFTTKERLHIT